MNRRSFISGLIRVGAFVALDPHRVIFDFGKNLFLPQVEVFAPGTWGALKRSDYLWPPKLERNRIDFLNMAKWGKVILVDPRPIRIPMTLSGIPLVEDSRLGLSPSMVFLPNRPKSSS